MKSKRNLPQIMIVSKTLSLTMFFTIFSIAMIFVTTLMISDALSFEGRRGASIEQRLSHLKEALALTDEQVEQVRPILEEEKEKRQNLRSNVSLNNDRSAMREKMMEIREETKKQLGSILTPEQLEQFDQIKQKGKRGGKRRMRVG